MANIFLSRRCIFVKKTQDFFLNSRERRIKIQFSPLIQIFCPRLGETTE